MSSGDPAAVLIDLERARCEATSSGDVAALREMYTDDMTYTHSTGVTQDVEALLDGVARSAPRLTRGDDLRVRFYGANFAVMTGMMRAELSAPDGSGTIFVLEPHVLQVWVRTSGGAWKQAAFASSSQLPPALLA